MIEFQEGLNDDLVSPTKLGSFAIPLNRIEEQCPHDGTPVRIVEQVSDSPLLSRGELMVEVRRCRISSDYFERKKQETVAKIRTVIEHITMFKEKEQDASGPLVLSANIMGTGKATVLHAAIQLQVPDIAEKLVDLGANPLEKSNLGTPLSLALNLQYRVQDKLFKAKATENVDTRGHQELFDLYHRITESLRRKINELKSASENTVVAKNSAKPPRGNGALVQPIQAPEATKALPKLDRKEFLVPNKKKICFRYDQPQGCHFGAKCHFAHIQAPLGEKLDGDNFFTADFPDWLNKIEPTVKKDGDWYTAGYYDKSRNVYYYAERLGGQKSHQGVYWYPTAKGAEEAVRRVVLVKATSESRLPSRSSDSSRGEKRSRDKSYYGP